MSLGGPWVGLVGHGWVWEGVGGFGSVLAGLGGHGWVWEGMSGFGRVW